MNKFWAASIVLHQEIVKQFIANRVCAYNQDK